MFNRYIPLIISAVLFFGWEIIIFFPKNFLITAAVIIILSTVLLLRLNKFNFKSKDFWLLASPCLFLILSASIFLLFLNYLAVKHSVVIILSVISYYFASYFYYFLCRITKYTPLSLESSSSYFNVISFLFLSISFYGFINLLNIKMWYPAVLLILAVFILTYQFFWINKVGERNNFLISTLVSVLMAEFFWSISFLPISHFISGLSLTIIYYVLINILLLHFLEKFDKKTVIKYFAIGLICIFVILLSARWL